MAKKTYYSSFFPNGLGVKGSAIPIITPSQVGDLDLVAQNFNNRNDRIATTVVAPTILTDTTSIDHILNDNGSVDISFEWLWSGTESDIDGFELFVYSSTSPAAYTIGSGPETRFFVNAAKRSTLILGVSPNLYYYVGVRAYRIVDLDINASGVLYSAWARPTLTEEDPYRPESVANYAGNIVGTIAGVNSSTVANYTRNFDRGNWSSATVQYYIGDEVYYEGSTYGCLQDHVSSGGNSPPSLPTTENSYWRVRARAGGDGTIVVSVLAYKRSATTPTNPSATATYNFGTFSLSGLNNGWTQSVPATDGNPLWVIGATATSIGGTTDTIAAGEWSSSVKLTQDGDDGAPGAAGSSLYTWIAYADSPDGTLNFSVGSPGNRTFIGIATNKTSATESTNPIDYTWSQYKGPPNFGLVGSSGITISGTKVIKTGSAGWNEAVYSSESFTGGAYVGFTPLSNTKAFMVGLGIDPTADNNYTSIDYALYCEGGGQLRVYRNGITTSGLLGPYIAGDKLAVHSDGTLVRYYQNGTVIHSHTPNASNEVLFIDSSFNTTGEACTIDSFSSAGAAGADGDDGANGLNNASVVLYRRTTSTTTPTKPSATCTYTFSTGVLTGQNNSWTQAMPTTGGEYRWMITATAVSISGTDTIAATEWSTPSVMAQDGADGATGPAGRDAVVFQQDTTPTGQVVGDTWVTASSPRIWRRWNGSSWVQLLGNIAAYDQVSASQMAVTQLSAITATIGTLRTAVTGARMEIRDNVLKVYDSSNVLRVKLGNLAL